VCNLPSAPGICTRSTSVPSVSRWGLAAALILLLATGALGFVRRRRQEG
jgi:LPXTG-motif cell wall-anchored protein